MTSARIALVTGANQGLGRALVEGLAARLGPDDQVLLTGRNADRVAEAAGRVTAEPGTRSRVEGRVLDVSDAGAVALLAAELSQRHGGVDLVVSNASAMLTPERSQSEQADDFVGVANGGTVAMLRSFAPVLRPGGRLLVVASSLGTLGNLDPRLHSLFDGASLDDVEKAVASWRTALSTGSAEDLGWPRWINVPSKVAQVAAVRAVAAERRDVDLPANRLIASVCPGLIDTALSRPWFTDFSGAQTPAQAAVAVLDLLLTERTDPAAYGELVRFGQVLDWHGGTPPRLPEGLLLP
ncbi:SDR family NAD(P)-dependent oxidoreductase [Streptomyces sp. NPDC007264]|uniref:SDR family NAD(P)-dependent oxidoreductase n=1 Tax=Streptomyces sp. NPDC007264 TaxID=3364777 RepID=UPI0036DA0168